MADDQLAKLSAAIAAAIANQAWNSLPDGTTFCNDFCQQILTAMGCTELNGLLARDMGLRVLQDIARTGDGICSWQEVTPQKAVDMAKTGVAVLGWSPIISETHGHVVIVAPEDMDNSPTWNMNVPMCASIAGYNKGPNRIMRVSEAYRMSNKPRYFAWLG